MSDGMTLTTKGWLLYEGPDDPKRNPARFRRCLECGGQIDLLQDDPLWFPEIDCFQHKVCKRISVTETSQNEEMARQP